MGRIFGTDGVRGIANEKLDVELALAISRAAGMIIKAEGVARPKILVGRDTRLSGEMLQCAVAAGLSSVGCDVELLGVVPTPTVAYLVKRLGANGGVMITASHNPFMYNGIKYFGGDGELTGLLLAETLLLSGKKASELKGIMTVYPQVMINISATPEMKEHLSDPEVKSYIDIETQRLEGDGRILVRPSGTEPIIRVMIEGRDKDKIQKLAEECAETLQNILK